MKKYLLIMLFTCYCSFAQSPWTVRFTVETIDTTVFLRGFGVADGATSGYDILHDIPVFVSAGDTTAYFPVTSTFISALSTDIRNSRVSSHNWNLKFQNMPFSTVSWFPDSLPPSGNFEIAPHHPDSIPSHWLNMRTIPAVVVPSRFQAAIRWSIPMGEDTLPPVVSAWSPPNGSTGNPRETNIYCEVRDAGTGVDEGTIEMLVNGIGVSWLATIDSIDGGFSIFYDPPIDFGWNTEVRVVLSAYDREAPANFVSDTIVWRTLSDTLTRRIDGHVGTGDPLTPIESAVVEIASKLDTTDAVGYFSIAGISDGFYTLRASAEGFSTRTIFLNVTGDTTLSVTLEPTPPPSVLLIDYDSGVRPFVSGTDTTGEDDVVANLLSSIGFDFVRTEQNPSLSSYRLDEFRYIILVTPVRPEGAHSIIPDADLVLLSNWLEADGRLLWIAPDAGPDYFEGSISARSFFNLFGAQYRSDGRPSAPLGNVASLTGEARWFFLNVNADYALNSMADNHLDEFGPTDESTFVALASQSTDPAPIAATGRVMFRDLPRYRAVLSSILFGGIQDGFFPNNKTTIFRACMDFLSKGYGVVDVVLPKNLEIRVFPNPFNSAVTIQGLGYAKSAEIIDMSGRVIDRIEVNYGEAIWSPKFGTVTGVYLIRENLIGSSIKIVYIK